MSERTCHGSRRLLFALALALALPACGAHGGEVLRVVDGKVQATPYISPAAYMHFIYSRLYAGRGELRKAEEQLRRALAMDPDSPYLHTLLAEARVGQGDLRGASEALDDALAREAAFPDALLLSAKLSWQQGRTGDAGRALQRCVAQNPENLPCHLGLVAHLERLERLPEARRHLLALLRRRPGAAAARERLGTLCWREADYACAASHLRKVLDEVGRGDLALLLAHVERGLGRLDRAVLRLRRAFDRTGGADVAAQLLDVLLQAGRAQEADDLLQLLRSEATGTGAAHLVDVHLRAGRAEALLPLLEAAKPDARIDLARARVLLRLGREAEARSILERHRAGQDGVTAELVLAGELEERRELLRASDGLRAAISTRPAEPALAAALSRVLLRLGQASEAVRVLRALPPQTQSNPAIRLQLAVALERAGDWKQAVSLMRQVLVRDPRNAAALNFVGYVLVTRDGDLTEARGLLERALREEPGAAHIIDSLGWLAYRRGDLTLAARLLGIAANLAPANPEVLEHQAATLAALGRPAEARTLLERALVHCVNTADVTRLRRTLERLERGRRGSRRGGGAETWRD